MRFDIERIVLRPIDQSSIGDPVTSRLGSEFHLIYFSRESGQLFCFLDLLPARRCRGLPLFPRPRCSSTSFLPQYTSRSRAQRQQSHGPLPLFRQQGEVTDRVALQTAPLPYLRTYSRQPLPDRKCRGQASPPPKRT